MDCIFCRIIAKQLPSAVIFEDDDIICIKDISPVPSVHLLVLPKAHILDLAALTDAGLAGRLLLACAQAARAAGLNSGYRVVTNCGEHGCQSIAHLHLHVLGGEQLKADMG